MKIYIASIQRNMGAFCWNIVITAIGTIGNSYIVKDGDQFYFRCQCTLVEKESEVVSGPSIWLKSPAMREQLDEEMVQQLIR